MRDDGRRQSRRNWPRVVLTATGLVATALATTYVIQTGATATTVPTAGNTISAPRTVVATIAAAAPAVPARPAADERAVRVSAPVAVPQAQVDLRQIVYTVAGNQRPDDPVTIVYADETGTLQRVTNVTLPWTLTVTPDVPVNYVTASSGGSQLNCWITDAAGSTVARQTDFATSVTCNR